ncbi:MAG: helix-turn-helix domain-containing protein [Clostridia bacterium]|nr:helix-turn-helix domain-containing protein [Clostridia bacterium]
MVLENLPEQGKMYSGSEVEVMFGKHRQTVLTWVWKGLVHPVKIGNRNYYKGEELLELLKSGRLHKQKKPRRKGHAGKKQTSICEDCLKAYNGCSWARHRVPVLGWDAKRLDIEDYKGKDVYRVYACPEFEEEKFYTDKNGIRRRVNEVPEEWKVHR